VLPAVDIELLELDVDGVPDVEVLELVEGVPGVEGCDDVGASLPDGRVAVGWSRVDGSYDCGWPTEAAPVNSAAAATRFTIRWLRMVSAPWGESASCGAAQRVRGGHGNARLCA
jgi:hypothetical protein